MATLFRIRYKTAQTPTGEAFFVQMPPADRTKLNAIICEVFGLNLAAFSAEDHDDASAHFTVLHTVIAMLAQVAQAPAKPIYLSTGPMVMSAVTGQQYAHWITCTQVEVG